MNTHQTPYYATNPATKVKGRVRIISTRDAAAILDGKSEIADGTLVAIAKDGRVGAPYLAKRQDARKDYGFAAKTWLQRFTDALTRNPLAS